MGHKPQKGPMSEEYNMRSTSYQTATLGDRVLSVSPDHTTRKIVRFEVIDNPKNPTGRLHVTLVHQRKRRAEQWEDLPPTPFSKLKAGEAAKFELDSATTAKLVTELQNALAISGGGVRFGSTKLVVGQEDEFIRGASPDVIKAVNLALAKKVPSEVWESLHEADADWLAAKSHEQVHAERAAALAEFKASLEAGKSEAYWQDFFEKNDWIFGYGLNYHVLRPVQEQPHYGGTDVSGRGAQRGDYLEATGGEVKFTVLLDIKKPTTELLGAKKYRNGAWDLGGELTGGVSQLQANCGTWEQEGARKPETVETLSAENIYTVQPRGILIAGHTAQLDDSTKRGTFERFRRNTVNPEILTFDEVYERAKFIVGNTDAKPVPQAPAPAPAPDPAPEAIISPDDTTVNLDDIPF